MTKEQRTSKNKKYPEIVLLKETSGVVKVKTG
jgi:hypothetical protein